MTDLIDLPKPINDCECWFPAVAVSPIPSAIGNARAWKYGVGIFRPQGRVFMSLYTSFLVLCHDRFIIDLPKPINDRECWFLAVAVSQISSAIGNARA